MLAKIALGNVRKSLRDFSVFFLTLMFGVCAFYAFGSINDQAAVINLSASQAEAVDAVMRILSGVSVFVAIILGFLVVYANRFLVRRRKREFGIYLTLGMGRSQVARIMVIETLVVGLAALAAGLALGVLLSQVMMYVTARLFDATIPGFTFVFSVKAALQTVGCFAVIFAVSLALDVFTVSRFKLIDLLNAGKKSEEVKVRSLGLSVVLFIASIAIMGTAYKVLLDHGLLSDEFGLATGLVTVGTALFFFSISGFLLRFVQSRPNLYLRGLNAFVLRQLNSRVNTAWVSITLVCAMLFVAICGVSTGFSLARGMHDSIERSAPYDASVTCYPMGALVSLYSDEAYAEPIEPNPDAQSAGFDMAAGFRAKSSAFDDVVRRSTQVDLYSLTRSQGGLSMVWCYSTTDYGAGNPLYSDMSDTDTAFLFVKLSQYNALREMLGKKPVDLAPGECLVWSDYAGMAGFWQAFVDQHPEIEALGTTLAPKGLVDETLSNNTSASVMGTIIVRDEALPQDAEPSLSVLDVDYAGPVDEYNQRFLDVCDEVSRASDAEEVDGSAARTTASWPIFSTETRQVVVDGSVGLTIVVVYLAIYIGVILLISCATVLAIQQLSEASDNAVRYRVLYDLGAEPAQVRRALMAQVGVYFAFPLVVAVCHAACALTSINQVVLLISGYDISNALLPSVCFVVALYGGYYLATYGTAKGMVLRS